MRDEVAHATTKACGHYERLMPWGLLHIRYNDKRLLVKILSLCPDLMVELIENQAAIRAGTQVANEDRL